MVKYIGIRAAGAAMLAGYTAVDFTFNFLSTFPNALRFIPFITLFAFFFIMLWLVYDLKKANDRLLDKQPIISIQTETPQGKAFLIVHNSGGSALFRATFRVIADSISNHLQVAYWEGLGKECRIDKDGQGSIKIAEKTLEDRQSGTIEDIRKGGLVGFRMGTSLEQIFAINTWVTTQNGNTTFSNQQQKGILDITITSDPEPLKKIHVLRYLVSLDNKGITLTELSVPDKGDSQP